MKRVSDTEHSPKRGTRKAIFLMSFPLPSIWKKPCDKPDLYLSFAMDGSQSVKCFIPAVRIQNESRYSIKNLDCPRLDPCATLCKSDFVYEKAEVNYAMV